jgi:hypothetical protein
MFLSASNLPLRICAPSMLTGSCHDTVDRHLVSIQEDGWLRFRSEKRLFGIEEPLQHVSTKLVTEHVTRHCCITVFY